MVWNQLPNGDVVFGRINDGREKKSSSKVLKVIAAVAVCAASCVASGEDASFEWPESGNAVIPKGMTVVVTDADYNKVNSLESIKIEEGATNVFRTSKAPTTFMKGYGAWVKQGGAYWTLTTTNTAFYGSFIIEEGVVTNAVSTGKGAAWTENKDKYEFVVKEGAMFVNANTDKDAVSFGPHRMHIAGTGVNGEGALVNVSSKGFTLCMLNLDGDAKISASGSGYFTIGPYSSTPGITRLNGHTLTIDSESTVHLYRNRLTGSQGGLVRVVGGDIAFGAEASYDQPFLCLEPDAGALSMACSGYISIKRDVPNIQIPLTIEAGKDVMLRHYHELYTSDCCHNAASNSWAGPITIEEGAILRVRTNRSQGGKHFRVSGAVKGPGSLQMLCNDGGNTRSGDIYLESPTNSFGGTLSVLTNVNCGSLFVSYSNSIPDYTKCNLVAGCITARLTPGEHAWTPASLVAFANGINRFGDTFVAMDARPMPDGTASFGISDFGPYESNDHYSFGADGGTVVISGKADKPVSLFSTSGTLKFTGEAVLTNTVATSVWTNRYGEMLLDGADVTTTKDGMYIGAFPNSLQNTWPLDSTPLGRLRIRDSRFVTDYSEIWDGDVVAETVNGSLVSNFLWGAVKVGWKGFGVIDIEGDSVVSNRFLVGCTKDPKYPNPTAPHHSTYGYGAIYQRGGEVALVGNKYWKSSTYSGGLGIGNTTFGFYEASGGNTILAGQFSCGSYGTGMLYVDGGNVVATNHPGEPASKLPVLYFAALNGSRCALYVKNGGRFYTRGETRCVINAANNMHGTFTAAGEGSEMVLGNLVVGSKNVTVGTLAAFNAIDGGTIEARRIIANSISKEPHFVNVCMNGGTIRAHTNGYAIFGKMEVKLEDGSLTNGPYTLVRVYGKGGAVDTAGHKEIFSDAPIQAAHGGGVSAIPYAPRTGCTYPPLVRIIGDGYGASAVAEFDSRSGTVTGVLVTSPGCGYTWAKAYFSYGYDGVTTGIAQLTNDCVIAQNDGKGSFAKKGEGTLTLRAQNNWGGDTILAGGVLKSGIDGAIPAGGTFVFAGGTLDMNGTVLSDGTPMPKKWAVDVHSAIENGTVVYDGDLVFPEGSTLELRGSTNLPDTDASFAILTVTGSVTGAPALPELDNPRWKAWWSGKSIKAKKFYGTTVVFR